MRLSALFVVWIGRRAPLYKLKKTAILIANDISTFLKNRRLLWLMIFLLLLPNTSVRFQKAKAAGRSNWIWFHGAAGMQNSIFEAGHPTIKKWERRYADGGRIDFIKRAFEYRFLLSGKTTGFLFSLFFCVIVIPSFRQFETALPLNKTTEKST